MWRLDSHWMSNTGQGAGGMEWSEDKKVVGPRGWSVWLMCGATGRHEIGVKYGKDLSGGCDGSGRWVAGDVRSNVRRWWVVRMRKKQRERLREGGWCRNRIWKFELLTVYEMYCMTQTRCLITTSAALFFQLQRPKLNWSTTIEARRESGFN